MWIPAFDMMHAIIRGVHLGGLECTTQHHSSGSSRHPAPPTARQEKAKQAFPRPVAGKLRPVVRGQTVKYNSKRRLGRGFTLEELKVLYCTADANGCSSNNIVLESHTNMHTNVHTNVHTDQQEAGISAKLAPTIGIAVDHRRRNRSLESVQDNANRLKAYKAKLVVFPRRAGKTKAGDASPEELKAVAQLQGTLLPISADKGALEFTTVTNEQKVRWIRCVHG